MDWLARLEAAFREKESVVVGFSGGVDSAVLAKVGARVLGERSLAVIVDSESYAPEEKEAAIAFARELDIPHEVVWHSELADANYVANPTDRCYFCRQGLSDVLLDIAQKKKFFCVAVGTNADDARDWRPGDKALRERGAWQPFLELGMTKADVRAVARELGLPVADKPSMACLSSRIPYGEPVTIEKLTRIGRAEAWLRARGFAQVRVRALAGGATARVEVLPAEIPRALALAEEMTRAFVALGFDGAEIDPRGYRTGAMNELAGLTLRS